MGRLLSIDYGQKRTGIAVSDPLKIIATALATVATKDLPKFLDDYINREEVETIVVGEPKQMNGKPSESSRFIEPFVAQIKKKYPRIKIERADERFTSKIAFQTMIDAGISRKARQDKATVDRISAVLILQTYMNSNERMKGNF